jgi:hypothetical protein
LSKKEQGFTDEDRRIIWLKVTGAGAMMTHANACSQSYDALVANCDRDFPTRNKKQIQVDLPRTFQDEVFYRVDEDEDNNNILKAIGRVCMAYSVRNQVVGYCQGFNFIVGRLLQVVTEEESFWVLTALLESILPLDYFCNMVGVMVD